MKSNNLAGFKYKYPDASPTPAGEDDYKWNQTYTAADSRMYNHHGKDSRNSKKFRESKETYALCEKIHLENKRKYAIKHPDNPLVAGPALTPKAPPKPKAPSVNSNSNSHQNKDTESTMDDDNTTSMGSMSISEKVKGKSRNRKPSSLVASSLQGSPGPSASPPVASPAMKMGSPAPTKIEKTAAKKKGTAAPVKKPAQKKGKPDGKLTVLDIRSAALVLTRTSEQALQPQWRRSRSLCQATICLGFRKQRWRSLLHLPRPR